MVGAHSWSLLPPGVPVPDLRRLAAHVFLRTTAALGLMAVALAGCINTFYRPEPRALARPAAGDTGATVLTPVKAHLADGSTVIFRGARIAGGRVSALGMDQARSFALLDSTGTPRGSVPLDSVVGLETFDDRILSGRSVAVSVATTSAGTIGTIALLKALFGSCPTVYADTGGSGPPLLQAEGFSYAIAPRLEHRDVDRLAVRAGADGAVRLELRNEALETHYVNHVELLAVAHDPGVRVLPDQQGRLIAVRALHAAASALDRAGRDVLPALARADGRLFASDPATVRGAREGDLDDWIDLVADDLPPGDSLAVVLRLRNSLLTTVLLYQVMLSGPGAAAWLAEGLADGAAALGLARWYLATMGMRAATLDSGGFQPAARLGDVGPIAFRDVALVLARPERDARRVGVRLRFVADNWRIDRVEVTGVAERPAARRVALSAVVVPSPAGGEGRGPVLDAAALAALVAVDEHYLETRPGQRMTLEFHDASPAGSAATTYLIAWQGWYREWLRGSWLATPRRPFVPGDAAVAEALARWRGDQAQLEAAFYATRIPVR
jgi:hypothetical protein